MEQRKSSRILAHFPVSFFRVQILVSFAGDRTGEGMVFNLSTGGCKVESDMTVYAGDYLTLRLHIPDQEGPLAGDLAAVRWAMGRDFGLEFLRVTAEAQDRLHRFLTTLAGS